MLDAVPDYENLEREAWRANAKQVKLRLSEGDSYLMKRIRKYVDRFGYSETEVKNKIKDDPMFAAWFAKEPRRTGFHQREAGKWLSRQDVISEFLILPQSGKKACYITSDGEIQNGEILRGRKPSKSLDFQWLTGSTICYAMHKYTLEGGGNQDSQYKEMQALLSNFQSCGDRDSILIVIVDGPYYTEKKMNELQNLTRSYPPCSYAVHLEQVPGILEAYIKFGDQR